MSCASFGKETLRRVSLVATVAAAAPAGPVTATPVVTPILCDFLRLLCKMGDVLRLLPLLAATAVPAALFGRTATTAAVKEPDPGATTEGDTEDEVVEEEEEEKEEREPVASAWDSSSASVSGREFEGACGVMSSSRSPPSSSTTTAKCVALEGCIDINGLASVPMADGWG